MNNDIRDRSDASPRAPLDAPSRAIRSASEIARILQKLCDEQRTISADLKDEELIFTSRIRHVDADLGRVVFDYSQWKQANSAVLGSKSVQLKSEFNNRQIQFVVTAPSQVLFEGHPRIQARLPEYVLDLQARAHRRFRIVDMPSLWCVIRRQGLDSILVKLSDISKGGLGAFVHDPGVVLEQGAIFENCQITGSQLKQPVNVSIEVRHWQTVRATDGTFSKRVGCRFIVPSDQLQQLVDAFEVGLLEEEA